MSAIDAVDGIVAFLDKIAPAVKYGSQINFAGLQKAIENKDWLTLAKDADAGAEALGVFIPPIEGPAIAAGAVIEGLQLLSEFSVTGKIPQVTIDLENTIAGRFQTPFRLEN